MESSIAEFVERQLACELLPTEDQAPKASQVLRHLKKRLEVCACLARKKFRGLRIPASWHACMSCAVVCMFQARVQVANAPTRCTTGRVCGFQQVGHAVVCMFSEAHQSYAAVACSRHRVAQSSSCKCSHSDSLQTVHLPLADQIW